MIIGFTGTRSGMSDKQKKEVIEYLKYIEDNQSITSTLHGGCVGADIDFHHICEKFHREVYPGHSAKTPENLSHRGKYPDADIIHPSQTHFKRNRDIVDRCDILIATPYNNIQRGGTWYTINYAEKLDKPTLILTR